jgi:type IV pilus assembly protein PilV
MYIRRHLSRQSGATMIEVLVALFVLSVGLLGVAAMQQVGLRNSHSAHLRSQATALAYDMADRMRANVRSARDELYNTDIDVDPDLGACVATPTREQVIECDVGQWLDSLQRVLPLGDGTIEVEPLDDGMQRATITVQWDDTRDGSDPLVFTTVTQL